MLLEPLIERYAAGARLLRQSVVGMTDEQLRARPISGKWSTLEVIAHLADFEIIGVDRLTAVIAEDEPVLPGRDEQQYARRLAYEIRDAEEQLQLIELCRSHVARLLGTLNDADLNRCGRHTEAGPLTLAQLLERSIHHVEHHVAFIQDKRRALGL